MSDHNKKGWYHSDLMKALKPNGTVLLMLKTDPMDSKFVGKMQYCVFAWEDAQGEQSEHTLNIEPELTETLAGLPKDVWLTCRVEGGKNVAPSITAEDEAGPVFVDESNAQPARTALANRTTAAPPAKQAKDHDSVARDSVDITVDVITRFRESSILLEGEAVAKIFMTVYIQLNR